MVSCLEQSVHHMRSNKPRSTCNEYFHQKLLNCDNLWSLQYASKRTITQCVQCNKHPIILRYCIPVDRGSVPEWNTKLRFPPLRMPYRDLVSEGEVS